MEDKVQCTVTINKDETHYLLSNLDAKLSSLDSLNDVLSTMIDINDDCTIPLFFIKQLMALTASFDFMIKDIVADTQKLWDCVIFQATPLE